MTDDQPTTNAPAEPQREPEPRRPRGLSAPYVPGGRDPEPDGGKRDERFYGGLLILMVAAIVLAGFLVSIIGLIAATPAR